MRFLRRQQADVSEARPDNVLWGVARREGHSDTDDPAAHEGLVQHAFVLGRDDQAVCGFQPPRRLSRADRTPRAQLALPGRTNPRCRRCEDVLAEYLPVPRLVDESDAESSEDAAAGLADDERSSNKVGRDGPGAGQTPRASTWHPRAPGEQAPRDDATRNQGGHEPPPDGSPARRRRR